MIERMVCLSPSDGLRHGSHCIQLNYDLGTINDIAHDSPKSNELPMQATTGTGATVQSKSQSDTGPLGLTQGSVATQQEGASTWADVSFKRIAD